jgi:predicted anti-sigma-YlaC factor YlaD
MDWNCAQTEERLSDYLDGLLDNEEQQAILTHVGGCPRCAPLVARVSGVVRQMRSLEEMETPPHLMERILDQTIGPRKERRRGWLGWLVPVWQPRFAMGAASVFATVFILLYVSGMNPAKLKRADLSPVSLYRSADRHVHLAYARGVKFVNDLRVVYEIESAFRSPAAQPAQEEPVTPPPARTPQQKSQDDSHTGRSTNWRASQMACILFAAGSRSPQ